MPRLYTNCEPFYMFVASADSVMYEERGMPGPSVDIYVDKI